MESNNDCEDEFAELNNQHRKERKQLQSTIQSLKKSASKGDKKKRKEMLEEITRLEIELEKKHSNELNEFQNKRNIDKPEIEIPKEDIPDDDTTLNANEIGNMQRISKAQKRRNKKALEEKQREAEILAQEEESKNGPRMMENRAIEELLTKRQLCLNPIASDGDCLYKAIQHQLQATGREFFTVSQLRHKTANYILENKKNLIFYMTNSNTGEILTDDDFTKYCENIRNTPAWGGQVELKALSCTLQVPIEVLQATGPPTIQGVEFNAPNLVVTYHRHMYSLGEHYNSTRPLKENEFYESSIDENELNINL